jgi:hypothetical protein
VVFFCLSCPYRRPFRFACPPLNLFPFTHSLRIHAVAHFSGLQSFLGALCVFFSLCSLRETPGAKRPKSSWEENQRL